MKYDFISEYKARHSITLLCHVLEVSPRGYYDWLTRSDSRRKTENKRLLDEIRQIFKLTETFTARLEFMRNC